MDALPEADPIQHEAHREEVKILEHQLHDLRAELSARDRRVDELVSQAAALSMEITELRDSNKLLQNESALKLQQLEADLLMSQQKLVSLEAVLAARAGEAAAAGDAERAELDRMRISLDEEAKKLDNERKAIIAEQAKARQDDEAFFAKSVAPFFALLLKFDNC